MKATDICEHCGKEFADHNYVQDSISDYRCPVPIQEGGYGFFPGGDPRRFHPDSECCTEEEIKAHKEACEFWDNATATPEPLKSECGWIYDKNGSPVAHICGSPFGVGCYTYEMESYFERREETE